jgi:beta-lactam-binding protein with PASTA domain
VRRAAKGALADAPLRADLHVDIDRRVQRNEEESELEVGRVIRQDPQAGTVVAVPARVVIWVSSGPAPTVEEPDTGAVELSRNFR